MKYNYEYSPINVCSTKMYFNIENNILLDLRVVGGCPGNSLGLIEMCKGKDIDEIINKLDGIRCGNKSTSCPDQISKALKNFKKNNF